MSRTSKKRKLNPLEAERAARRAYELLVEARDLLVLVGAPKAAQRVRLARTSAQGAVRAAEGRATRYQRDNPDCLRPPETVEARQAALACPECGEQPGGTVEVIPGTAGFVIVGDALRFSYDGETKVFYEGGKTKVDPITGTLVLECGSCHHEYPSPPWFEETSQPW